MLLAAIGDIHGNLPALQAVLDVLDAQGIQTIVDTGDLAVGSAWPNEVVDTLRQRGIPSVQGMTDHLAVRFSRKQEALRRRLDDADFRAVEWTYRHLRTDTLEYLRALPKSRAVSADGTQCFVCHGTPATPSRWLEAASGLDWFRRAREEANAPIVICGRSHQPFTRTVEGTLFVNPGSVGAPLAAPDPGGPAQAAYAVIDTEADPSSASILYTAYPWQPGNDPAAPVPPLMSGPVPDSA